MSISDNELYELFGALTNDVITPQQHDLLAEALSKDPVARGLYYQYTDVHIGLRRIFDLSDLLGPAGTLDSDASKELSPAQHGKQRRLNVWTHFGAIAATILGVLGFHILVRDEVTVPASIPVAESTTSDLPVSYIATLVKSADCIWEGEHGPKFDGQRLLTNELHLREGVAEFGFDAGVRIVMEGPAFLTIDSATSAMLTNGKVVLHGSEMSGPFALRTPLTTLLDIGTEYGAVVGPQGDTEVYVFDGEVSVIPSADTDSDVEPQQMTVGQASRFDTTGRTSIDFASTRFVRQVPESSLPSLNQKKALLAYEGFDYQTKRLGNANGGLGWIGPWRAWYRKNEPSFSRVRFDNALGQGSCLRVFGKKKVSWRTLENPIRLDTDGVYYLSFLLRKIGELEHEKSQWGAIELRTSDSQNDDSKLSIGMSSERFLCITHNKQQLLSAPSMPINETIRFVLKIVAGQEAPDQVMARWYGPAESLGVNEPYIWSARLQPEYGNAVFNQLSIRVGGDVGYLVDELRLGTNWSSIANGSSMEPIKH